MKVIPKFELVFGEKNTITPNSCVVNGWRETRSCVSDPQIAAKLITWEAALKIDKIFSGVS